MANWHPIPTETFDIPVHEARRGYRSDAYFWRAKVALERAKGLVEGITALPAMLRTHGLPVPRDGARRSMADLLSLEGMSIDHLAAIWPELDSIPAALRGQIEADCRYAGYLSRQTADIDALARYEAIRLPADFDWILRAKFL